jgi:hypothetical protein
MSFNGKTLLFQSRVASSILVVRSEDHKYLGAANSCAVIRRSLSRDGGKNPGET